ncbi:MAG: pyridoxal phosphate-dependent aminotransferase [Alcanivorax sp.]|jgi:aspartate aminotransferase|nr:pyridoxal phosphate-dependent aminotransferase [Pseudomonadota bacterium]|tara:strand:+ start:48 stop:1238 length:1191 start_codon:yes stop_codon:yes gene_type:complete
MSDINLSDRVQRIKPSPTLAITSKAAELRAQGKDIIGLGAGEPDFDTPDHIKQAAIEAINAGKTKYTPVDGTPGLKKAVVDKFKRENGLDYEAGQILVSSGGKQSFFNMALALLNDGDEAIIPAPYWVSYPDMVKVAGGVPVVLETDLDSRFKITPQQLEQAITPKTRLFVINSPSNPSGMAYSKEELAALGEVLKKHPDIVIATDDMYEHILWTGQPFVNIVNACPELYDRTVVMNGVSKAYSMTGWRIGYAGGPQKLIAAMKKVQSQSTSNPASISQAAAEAALSGDQQCVKDMVKAFKERHDYVVDALNKLPGVTCAPSDGTFYAFPDFSGAIAEMDGVESCTDLAAQLLETAEVALVPGSAFGAPGCLRLSFAVGMDTLVEAISRIEKALSK